MQHNSVLRYKKICTITIASAETLKFSAETDFICMLLRKANFFQLQKRMLKLPGRIFFLIVLSVEEMIEPYMEKLFFDVVLLRTPLPQLTQQQWPPLFCLNLSYLCISGASSLTMRNQTISSTKDDEQRISEKDNKNLPCSTAPPCARQASVWTAESGKNTLR